MTDRVMESGAEGTAAGTLLDALLRRLRTAGEAGEVGYERLRARLIAFFRLQLPAQADSLADAALDRLARRLAEGVEVDNVALYALGIGRMLVKETLGRLERERRAALESARQGEIGADEEADGVDSEAALAALSACLESLGREAADLILAYYGADGAARIERRRQLAQTLGLSVNALRNRALRLRARLEECASARLAAHGAAAPRRVMKAAEPSLDAADPQCRPT